MSVPGGLAFSLPQTQQLQPQPFTTPSYTIPNFPEAPTSFPSAPDFPLPPASFDDRQKSFKDQQANMELQKREAEERQRQREEADDYVFGDVIKSLGVQI